MKPMGDLAEALALMTESVSPVPATETIPIADGTNRVLAVPVQAQLDLPGHTQSAMDGYAVRAGTCSPEQWLPCIGTSWAGKPFDGRLSGSQCVRIFTGAVLPEGADAVILQEETEVQGPEVRFTGQPKTGDNVRHAGEDVRAGDLLLDRGTRVQSEHLGLLVAAGHAHLRVHAAPRVACFSNGDELRAPGTTLCPGELHDSNRLVLQSDISEFGGHVVQSGCLPDVRDEILGALEAATQHADLIVTSGGASVGDADHLLDVASSLGEVRFWKLPIKPGKPVLFGRVRSTWLLALPGNPVSSWVTSRLILRPLLGILSGRPLPHMNSYPARLSQTLHKRPGRSEYQRGCMTHSDSGGLEVQAAGPQGSHRLSVLSRANCLIHLTATCGDVDAGEQVRVIPFSELRGAA